MFVLSPRPICCRPSLISVGGLGPSIAHHMGRAAAHDSNGAGAPTGLKHQHMAPERGFDWPISSHPAARLDPQSTQAAPSDRLASEPARSPEIFSGTQTSHHTTQTNNSKQPHVAALPALGPRAAGRGALRRPAPVVRRGDEASSAPVGLSPSRSIHRKPSRPCHVPSTIIVYLNTHPHTRALNNHTGARLPDPQLRGGGRQLLLDGRLQLGACRRPSIDRV